MVGNAALAVATGVADCVVCWRALNARSEYRAWAAPAGARHAIEFQYQTPYGYATPPQQFAMYARAYMDATAWRPRTWAGWPSTNGPTPSSTSGPCCGRPLTMEDYLASRWVVEPFRLYDCCLETDAAIAVVVTSAERARTLRRAAGPLSGAVWGGGHTLYSNRREDLARSAAADASQRLTRWPGSAPADIDVACIYDAFTPLVLIGLEDYGFCAKGDAAAFVADGHTALGGACRSTPTAGTCRRATCTA